jgi:hypothetical protein
MNTEQTGSVTRVPTPMEQRIANCEAIVAAFTILDSLNGSTDNAMRKMLLINSANLAPIIADC